MKTGVHRGRSQVRNKHIQRYFLFFLALTFLVIFNLWNNGLAPQSIDLSIAAPNQTPPKTKNKDWTFHTDFTYAELLNKPRSGLFTALLYKKDPHIIKNCTRANANYREWSKLVKDLPICRLVKTLYKHPIEKKATGPLVANAKMYNHVHGIHATWICAVVVACTALGLFLSHLQHDNLSACPLNTGLSDQAASLPLTKVEAATPPSAWPLKGHTLTESAAESEDGAVKMVKKQSSRRAAAKNFKSTRLRSTATRKNYINCNADDQFSIAAIQNNYSGNKNFTGKDFAPPRLACPSTVCPLAVTHSQQCLSNVVTWWTKVPTFTSPTITFKLYIAITMLAELMLVNVPNVSSYSTPELIAVAHRLPPVNKVVPSVAQWLMPDLNETTADTWVQRLEIVRLVSLSSWLVFLALPVQRSYIGATFYSIGAVTYYALGAIAVNYENHHALSTPLLFVLAASFAVPTLETNARSAAWLRQFLLLLILIPSYLLAAISKIRYDGIWTQLTGQWFPKRILLSRSLLPGLVKLMNRNSTLRMLMSWGNLGMELILPLAVLWKHRCLPLRYMFHIIGILFHVSILVIMSPNFFRHSLLHVLAMDPLSWCSGPWPGRRGVGCLGNLTGSRLIKSSSDSQQLLTTGDWLRIAVGLVVLAETFRVQFASDFRSVLGAGGYGNPYLPVPEYSMFVGSKAYARAWKYGLALDLFSVGLYIVPMLFVG